MFSAKFDLKEIDQINIAILNPKNPKTLWVRDWIVTKLIIKKIDSMGTKLTSGYPKFIFGLFFCFLLDLITESITLKSIQKDR